MVWTFTQNRCTERAVRWMQVGCVHEHIQIGAACAEHKQMLLAGDPLISCTPCQEGGDPHRCKLVARVISNEERNRIVRARRAAKEADRG
jgi:hypothetical protein